ncbi:MAG: N-acetylmuramoyl-L-alanine amidase [Candidatus Peribacteraceae bacterium]|nr:N-acetylmuramoyl-L-alanine amidase [Candidatus Peribacteraceae bacterium]
MRKLLFLAFLLTASTLNQQTITFEQPIDALSVRFAADDTHVEILLDDEWHELSIEKEFDPMLRESNLVMLPKHTKEVVLRGQLNDIALHPIRVSDAPASYELASTFYFGKPTILSRTQWGANDEYLFSGPPVERSDVPTERGNGNGTSAPSSSKRADDCARAQRSTPSDFKAAKTVTHDSSGKRYRWAKRYSSKVKLLVVHHTAQTIAGDDRSALERMRALYEYHANSRSWGDIGYHYVIDEQGTIYEGRSGGVNVVGGHVYCGNVGTVGVALMGNFEKEQPTLKQVKALQWLLMDLSKAYDIDLNKHISFKGKSTSPIVRHKDLISTDCPGYYMTSAFSQMRRNTIAGNVGGNVTFASVPKKSSKNRTNERLSARLEKAGEVLSRRFFRSKRLIRTAERQTTDKRLKMIKEQRASGSNVQRQRAARQKLREKRGLTKTGATAKPQITRSRSRSRTSQTASDSSDIRIRLSYAGSTAEVSSSVIADVGSKRTRSIRLGRDGARCVALDKGKELANGVVRIDPGDGVLTIKSWNSRWNRFKGVIECRVIDGQLVLINEVHLETYLAGLSEQPDTEPYEKQRAFAIAARSYASHYMEEGHRKFPDKPYDGSDTGKRFQSYSGVTYEDDNPRWIKAVRSTDSKVITVDGKTVKAAYFSSDDGRTRSPHENGWKNFPFAFVFHSKPDPWCEGMRLHGHGVGMSGCGAKAQALEGKSAEEILKYYYSGTEIMLLFR